MSSDVEKYRIHYDQNDGMTGHIDVYCKYENTCDFQLWLYDNGRPVEFGCCTDSFVHVMASCMLGKEVDDKFFYWEEIKDFDLPEAVKKVFYPNR